MSKHTAGPWTAIGTGIHAGDKYIATVHDRYSPNDHVVIETDEVQANAILIAAVPELYLALDQLLRVTVDEDLKHGIQLTEAEQEAREYALAVIAKAIID